mmetsp:Transcript_29202/g.72829  ORF Transcript_29202/g.72829 Transcript_29202/m.72829 type:complete len:146 (-) Transcript_29202:1077-1514(-)
MFLLHHECITVLITQHRIGEGSWCPLPCNQDPSCSPKRRAMSAMHYMGTAAGITLRRALSGSRLGATECIHRDTSSLTAAESNRWRMLDSPFSNFVAPASSFAALPVLPVLSPSPVGPSGADGRGRLMLNSPSAASPGSSPSAFN